MAIISARISLAFSPLGESPVTLAIMAARQRSESAEPPQNFSSNRKPTTAEEMRDFLYGHKCDSSGSLFGTEVSASNLQDDESISKKSFSRPI